MARRKITDITDMQEAAELPDLTAQQMNFVRGLLEGKSATAAYTDAYDCQTHNMNTIWANASRLRSSTKVQAWLAAARKAELINARITADQHIQRLDRLAAIAVEKGNIGAAVQAEQLIGKVRGHYVERIEHTHREDPLPALKRLHEINPERAQELAERYKINLTEEQAATRH